MSLADDLERLLRAAKRVIDVHRGWCNFCKGNEEWCRNAPPGCCSVPELENSIVALRNNAEAIVAALRQAGSFADGFKRGRDAAMRQNSSGCCCKIAEDGETILSACDAHKAWARQAGEPVAWMNPDSPSGVFSRFKEGADNFGCRIPLYASSPSFDAGLEAAAQIVKRLAEMMESGAGELEPGGRLRQAVAVIREAKGKA